ncbi:MAG: hypothetical protein KDB63_17910 [Nocardioidaceae bacterium]|nr:hypothetical protein [Nocardioidaceae bacterium]
MKIRIASILAAGALALSPLALSPVADASAPDKAPARNVTSKVVKVKGHLVFKGHVSDGYNRKQVIIQRATCKPPKCNFKTYKTTKTSKAGKYSARIGAPARGSWYFRAKVKAAGGFATSYSGVWRTYRL